VSSLEELSHLLTASNYRRCNAATCLKEFGANDEEDANEWKAALDETTEEINSIR